MKSKVPSRYELQVTLSMERPNLDFITSIPHHSMLRRLVIRLKILSMGPSHGEKVCIRSSEYILLEILDTWPLNPPSR